ncbi:hypothetical protein GCM10027403_24230 [Arthrobacter tecti]
MAHPARTERPTHSGQGHLIGNILAFVVMLVLFTAAIFSLTFFEKTNVWPFAVCLVLFFLAFWIPQTILGRSDTGGQIAKGERKA